MEQDIHPSRQALTEALSLSSEILRNIEYDDLPLENIALKVARLARLLNDFEFEEIMRYEVGGYPTKNDGIPPRIWKLGIIANRVYEKKDEEEVKQFMYLNTIGALEQEIKIGEVAISAAKDPNISISSANP